MSNAKLPDDMIQRLVAIDAELTSWFLANRLSDDFGSHPSELAYCDLSNSITDLVLDKVIGFTKPERELHGRFIHIDTDCPWFPVKPESLTLIKGDWVAVLVNRRTGIVSKKTEPDTEQRIRNFVAACDTYNPKFKQVAWPDANVRVGDRIFKEPI